MVKKGLVAEDPSRKNYPLVTIQRDMDNISSTGISTSVAHPDMFTAKEIIEILDGAVISPTGANNLSSGATEQLDEVVGNEVGNHMLASILGRVAINRGYELATSPQIGLHQPALPGTV